jgi:hypothetical protein
MLDSTIRGQYNAKGGTNILKGVYMGVLISRIDHQYCCC